MSNFAIDTRYPADKIVWLRESSLTTDSYGSWNTTISHNVGAIIFVKGVWSPDNWNTIYPVGVSQYQGGVVVKRSQVTTTSTSVNFTGVHTSPNTTIKYRLWGVAYDSTNIAISETASKSTNKFVIDTRTNLPRLFAEGYLNAGTTYNHNLGHIPYCDVWASFDGSQYSFLTIDLFGTVYGIGEFLKITNNQLISTNNTGTPAKFYFRIYD